MRCLLLLILVSCSASPEKTAQRPDDYVLVEFASLLEEDYEKNGGAALKASYPE